ncbi:MAG: DNA replication/repair protein RecF [Microthrixaceae bacterium]
MELHRLWLRNFRSHREVDLEWSPGVNLVVGPNGSGKTNLVEAVGFLSTSGSFRGVSNEVLITAGTDGATVRAEVDVRDRRQLVEIDVPERGRVRMQVNRQRLQRRRELLETLQVTIFGPDDLDLVKSGPSARRDFLDELVVQLRPIDEQILSDWERSLRQRNSLLKQSHGRLDEGAALTLDVWDTKAAAAGSDLHDRRTDVVQRLQPFVRGLYARLAGLPETSPRAMVDLVLSSGWSPGIGLNDALVTARTDDVRRGVTTVGPHRAELLVSLGGLPARTHASQGEQRCLALALRLAGHEMVTRLRDDAPVLILDDVFSELDEDRATALVEVLPPGQTFITSATGAPPGVVADGVVRIVDGVPVMTRE